MGSRKLIVEIIGDATSLTRSFRESNKETKKFAGQLDQTASKVRSSLIGMAAGVAGGVGLVEVLKASSEAASNLAEQTTAASQVFGMATRQVQAFSRNALLLAEDQALETANAIGSLLIPMGYTQQAAADLSIQMTRLGRDFSSMKNIPLDEALTAIRAGLVGEFEPLRRLGVVLDAATVAQEALRESGKKSEKQLTNQEKTQARINLIMAQSTLVTGDAARTLGGLANQQRELQKNVRNLQIAIGTALNPAVVEITRNLNKWLSNTDNQKELLDAFRQTVQAVTEVGHNLADIFRTINDVTGSTKNTVKLLLGAFVAFKVLKVVTYLKIAQAILKIGNNSQFASARVGKLSRGLGALRALGTIGIVITISSVVKGPLQNLVGKAGINLDESLIENIVRGVKNATGHGKVPIEITPVLRIKNIQIDPETRREMRRLAAVTQAAMADAAGGTGGITAEQRNTFFDNRLTRMLDRVQDIGSLRGQLARLKQIADIIRDRINVTRDITRKLNLEDQLLDVIRSIADTRRDIGDALLGALDLNVQRAGLTTTLNDDLAALQAVLAAIRRRIKLEGATLDLLQQEVGVQSQIKGVVSQQAQQRAEIARKAREATSTRQFRALGFGPGGSELVPNAASLRKTLGRISEAVKGTFLDTSANKSLFAAIRRVLSGQFGKITAEVRQFVDGLLDDIDDSLDKTANLGEKWRKINVDAFLASLGLDLTPSQLRRLKAGLAGLGPNLTLPPSHTPAFAAATGGVTVNGDVHIHGVTNWRQIEEQTRKRAKQRPNTRRGAR